MAADLKNPQYWRVRAEEVMSVAENLVEDREIREIMHRIADDYARIAKIVEKKRDREQKYLP